MVFNPVAREVKQHFVEDFDGRWAAFQEARDGL